MNKKEIQKTRMKSYFIHAVDNIIKEEGIQAVTTRKVADMAGYNSATLYNYFENMDHLIFFGAIKYIEEYIQNLPKYVKDSKNALDKYFRTWECFCYYSFNKLEIFQAIFYVRLDSPIEDAIKEYYNILPNDISKPSIGLFPILHKYDMYNKEMSPLKACVSEGFFKEENINEINEITLLIYQGMLSKVIENKVEGSIDNLVSTTLKYIRLALNTYTENHKNNLM